MKKIQIIGATVFAISLAYCKSTKTSTSSSPAKTAESEKAASVFIPSEKQIQIAQTRWPNTVSAELSEGQFIYANNCNKCHELFEISRFSEKKWIHEIADMAPKAELNKDQTAKLTKYILSYRESTEAPKTN